MMIRQLEKVVVAALLIFLFSSQAMGQEEGKVELDRFEVIEDTTQGALLEYCSQDDLTNTNRTKPFLFSIPFDVTYEVSLEDCEYEILISMNKWREPTEADGDLPEEINDNVTIEEHFWRDIRILKVSFNPLFLRNNDEDSYRFSRAGIRLNYGSETTADEPFFDGPFESVYRSILANYEISKTRRGRKPDETEEIFREYQTDADGNPSLKFTISEPGLYKIPCGQLVKFGGSYDTATDISLWRDGVQVPVCLRSVIGRRGIKEEHLLFYSPQSQNHYSREILYWLTSGMGSVAGMEVSEATQPAAVEKIESFTEIRTLEVDRVFPNPGEGPLRWFWLGIPANYSGFHSLEFDLPGLVTVQDATAPVVMRLNTYSSAKKDILFELHINDAPAQQFTLTPGSNQNIEPEIRAGDLKAVGNTIRVYTLPGDENYGPREFVFIDKIYFEYPGKIYLEDGQAVVNIPEDASGNYRDFLLKDISQNNLEVVDITQSTTPEWLNSRVYSTTEGLYLSLDCEARELLVQTLESIPEVEEIVPDEHTDLHSPENQYDYIILSHSKFIEELYALKAYREQQGHKVLLLDVQEVYDEFGHGNKSAGAIRGFLQYVSWNWEKPLPAYVLLVGDSNWDFWNKKGLGIDDYLPPYIPKGRPRYPPEDFWYVQSDTDIGLTDYLLGRFPVKHPEEVRNIISKTKAYEQNSPAGWWKVKILMFSDDGFEREQEKVAHKAAETGMMGVTINQSDYPYTTSLRLKKRGHKIKFCTSATAKIVEEMDDGCLMAFYMGHGGAIVMSEERIFLGTDRGDSDIQKLNNAPKFPMLFSMSCLTGLFTFDEPYPGVSIGEEWLRHPDKGGIGAYLPTGKGSTVLHIIMANEIVDGIFKHRLSTFGSIIANMRNRYWLQREDTRIIDEYAYFGDPACKVQVPEYRVRMEPESIKAPVGEVQTVTVRGEVNSEVLQEATGELRMYDKDGNILWHDEPFELENGRFERELSLDQLGEIDARLMCYVWNPETQQDGFGFIDCYVQKPDLEIRNMQFIPDVDEEKVTALVEVRSNKPFDHKHPVSVVWDIDGENAVSEIDLIENEEVKQVSTEFSAGSGVYRVTAQVNPDSMHLESDQSNNTIRRTYLWQGPEAADEARIVLSPMDIRIKDATTLRRNVNEESAGAVEVEIWNHGGKKAEFLKCVLISVPDGEIIAEKEGIAVDAGSKQEVSIPFKDELPDEFEVEIIQLQADATQSTSDAEKPDEMENPESLNQ